MEIDHFFLKKRGTLGIIYMWVFNKPKISQWISERHLVNEIPMLNILNSGYDWWSCNFNHPSFKHPLYMECTLGNMVL